MRPEYLAAIVESSDDAIISKDLNGIIQSCNAATERIFGYPASELIGKPVRVLIPPDRQSEEDDILARLRRGQRIEHYETVRLTKDKRLIDVSLTVSPVRDASGKVIGASKIARDITEQKRARATESYLAAIVESCDDAIIAKDLNGVVQACNASTERMFGYTAAELIGQSIRILIPFDRQKEEDDILATIRDGGQIKHFETIRLGKDGRQLEVSLAVSPIRDASGKVIGIAKVVRDITEQKKTARALAEQQQWFRVTLESIGDAVIASDPQGRVVYLNAPAEALSGWTLAEAKGKPLGEVFHIVNEDTRKRVENPAEMVMKTGAIVGLANHTILISRDGAEHPIADSAAPIRDGGGEMAGVVLVFRDVSEERKHEAMLAEQRQWFETTLASIGDAVIATDMHGDIVFMNPIAERLTGWPLGRARGQACADIFKIINEDTRNTVVSPVTRVLAEGRVVGLANHTLLIAADGTERPIDDSGAPICDADGKIAGVVLVFRDVSDRRRVERERQSAAVEREQLLTAERAARAEAERANRLKDDFVAMVSHELRTPLNAILGWTHLLTKAADASTLERGLDVISRNTRIQAELISDLLDVSRIVSGKLRLEIAPIDLSAIVRDSIETVQQEADAKRIRIVSELSPACEPIAGDGARLQQVVWNLLSNAIKFTPDGGTITVRLLQRGSDIEFSVADTGVGIRADFLPHIFDRFQQADRSITRRFGGLGLGLAIVKHLVELHGGTVRAESAGEGTGAAFTITVPCSTVFSPEVERRKSPHGHVIDEDDVIVSLDGIRVLVIEDEPDTAEFLDRFLRSCGAEVVLASSSAEALKLLESTHPDIIVSDIGLPDVDGYDLMQRIRELDAGRAIPAIALTAYARREDRARASEVGYQAHLSKPIEPRELAAKVASFARLIEAQRQRQ